MAVIYFHSFGKLLLFGLFVRPPVGLPGLETPVTPSRLCIYIYFIVFERVGMRWEWIRGGGVCVCVCVLQRRGGVRTEGLGG